MVSLRGGNVVVFELSSDIVAFLHVENRLAYAITLTAFGVLIIFPLSIGNNPNGRTPGRAIFIITLTVMYTM